MGSDGQLGRELLRTLSPIGEVVALTRLSLDLSNTSSVVDFLDLCRPQVIVNSAAYTNVEKAESDYECASLMNAIVPKVLALWAEKNQAFLIHYSTDYVFDGSKTTAYVEADVTSPQSVYGITKAQGEVNIRSSLNDHFILRTSWLFSVYGKNFLKNMLDLMRVQKQIKVVNDQIGAPTSAFLVASVTAHIVRDTWYKRQNAGMVNFGTYHLVSQGEVSWYNYAQYIAQLTNEIGMPVKTDPSQIIAISSDEYPSAVIRPCNSCLNTSLLKTKFGIYLPHWKSDVQQTFESLVLNQ